MSCPSGFFALHTSTEKQIQRSDFALSYSIAKSNNMQNDRNPYWEPCTNASPETTKKHPAYH